MENESRKEFIKRSYEEYKKLGHVECPAFNFEKVHFNKKGFQHLIWKGKKLRSVEQQIRRINLFKKVIQIIALSTCYFEYEKVSNKNPPAQFWSFVKCDDGKIIKVIIRQVGNGNKHFFSVMDKTK